MKTLVGTQFVLNMRCVGPATATESAVSSVNRLEEVDARKACYEDRRKSFI